jgi:hypothetical protein
MHKNEGQLKLADIRGVTMPFLYDKGTSAVAVMTGGSKIMDEAERRGYKVKDNRISTSALEMAELLSAYYSDDQNKSLSPQN